MSKSKSRNVVSHKKLMEGKSILVKDIIKSKDFNNAYEAKMTYIRPPISSEYLQHGTLFYIWGWTPEQLGLE